MRRGTFILVFCLLLAAGGSYMQVLGPRLPVPQCQRLQLNQMVATGLFLCAIMVALLGVLSLRAACRRLAAELLRSQAGPETLSSVHPDLCTLTAAANQALRKLREDASNAKVHARELELQLKVVTAERQYIETIIHSISDAVLVTDPFDEVVLANDSAARTFSFDLAGAERAPIESILKDPQMVALIRDMRRSDSRNARRVLEHSVAAPEGDRTYRLTLSCIAGQGEQPSGVVAVLHDMTREKELAKIKNDFVSNVSHELRTPLASIKAYVEMLIDGEATDEKTAREFYEIIHNEANRLGRLIDNILNISRIESGLVKINKRPQSLLIIVKDAVGVILPQARQKQITVEEQGVPAIYQTLVDRDMLYEAVLNLLSNAIKYTPEGGRILVQTAVEEARNIVSVRITDNGVGIPPKDLPFVFDKFYRSESNSRMAKGTGLGLSLVKHIVESVHHGRMIVESQVGQGSTFGFELDLIQ